MTKLGMNLTKPVYWSKDRPFIDRMKTSGDWVAQGPKGVAIGPVPVDDRGWPTAFPDGATRIYTMLAMSGEVETYAVRHNGGDMSFKFQYETKVLDRQPGYTLCSTYAGSGISQQFIITALDPNNPPTDISVVPVRLEALWLAGQSVDPDYVARRVGEAGWRFMDWQGINNDKETPKNPFPIKPMPRMDQRSWMNGAPVEVCLELARIAGGKPRVNIPECIAYDDDALRTFFAKLPKGCGVEWMNEVWNKDFGQGWRAYVAGGSTKVGHQQFVGKRMGQVAKIAHDEFGLQLTVGWQPSVGPTAWDKWEAAWIAGGGSGHNSEFMTSGYPSGGLNTSKAIAPYVEAHDIAGAIKAFATDVQPCIQRVVNMNRLSVKHGTTGIVYEFNAHMDFPAGNKTAVPFIDEMLNDPRVAVVFDDILRGFADNGCTMVMIYNDSQGPSTSGTFGVQGRPLGQINEAAKIMHVMGIDLYQ